MSPTYQLFVIIVPVYAQLLSISRSEVKQRHYHSLKNVHIFAVCALVVLAKTDSKHV